MPSYLQNISFPIISSALPLAGGAYPMRGVDVVIILLLVLVRQLLFQIATPPKLLARSFSNFTQRFSHFFQNSNFYEFFETQNFQTLKAYSSKSSH